MNANHLAQPERKRPRHRFLIAALSCAALAGCSGGDGADTSTQANAAAASSPAASEPIIDNEDLSTGLRGIDTDGNGIRDDIDRLIAKRFATTPQLKKAAEQKARALQKAMEATTREQALAAGDRIMRASACVYKTLPHSTAEEVRYRQRLSIEIEALTANTKERFKAYWAGAKLSGGAVYEQAREPVCD